MKIFIFTIVSLLISSCSYSPRPLIRLNEDENQNFRWVRGSKLLEATKKNVTVYLKYQKSDQQYHMFKIFIKNNSEKDIFFDPANSFISSRNTNPTIKQFASDPEDMLLRIDSDYSRKEAHHKSAESFDSFFRTLDLISDISTIGEKKTVEERNNEELQEINEREYRAERKYHKQVDLYEINSRRNFWEGQTVRKETVSQNQSAKGFILFPYDSRDGRDVPYNSCR